MRDDILGMNRAELWKVKDVAKFLGVSSITVYRLTEKGNLPGHKVGSQWRFIKEEIDRWVREKH